MKLKLDTGNLRITLQGADILNPKERAKKFAQMAKDEIALVSRLNDGLVGKHVPYETFVDGSKTSDLFKATESSQIVAEWQLKTGVVEYIHDLLKEVGPRKSGRYRASAMMFADGKKIDDPKQAQGANTVLFVSTVPYARKIERGKKGYAPGAVYESVAAMAKGRFGNLARINFTFSEPPTTGDMLHTWAMKNAFLTEGKAHKRTKRLQKNLRNPAIVVYLRG